MVMSPPANSFTGMAAQDAVRLPGQGQGVLEGAQPHVPSEHHPGGAALHVEGELAQDGGVAGLGVGHGIAYVGSTLLAARGGLIVNPFIVGALQPIVFGSVVIVGALAGLLPALLAYRTEVAENLAPLS